MELKLDGIWAPSPTTIRGQPTILTADKKGERIGYAANKSIYLRNIDNPSLSKEYTGHTVQTTVARFSPSGFYVASGDISGTIRVWDCVGEDATKGEYHIIAGRILDIDWDADSQRIIAVGEGKERFGHCFTADSGNSVGEISGHSARINCVSIRHQRPYKAITGSDDTSLVFYDGVPFKFNTSHRDKHQRFVYGVAFSPDGSRIVSVGADQRIWLYDAKTCEPISQISKSDHSGSIFGVSWSSDSRRFVTASADKTVRIWDVEAEKVIKTWQMGDSNVKINQPEHQQVGVVWPSGRSDDLIISVDLSGNLNYFLPKEDCPVKVITGHQKSITSATLFDVNSLVTGSYEGRLRVWDLKSGTAQKFQGLEPTCLINNINVINVKSPNMLCISSWDDSLRTAVASEIHKEIIKLNSQPQSVTFVQCKPSSEIYTLVATLNSIEVYDKSVKSLIFALRVAFTPSVMEAVDMNTIVIGSSTDGKLRLCSISSDGKLQLANKPNSDGHVFTLPAPITALKFNPAKSMVAIGTKAGKIVVLNKEDWKVITDRWTGHTAKIDCLAWHSEGQYLVSGSLDTHLMLWSLSDPGRRISAKNAHKDGVVSVLWSNKEHRIFSCGADAVIKLWKVNNLD